MKEDWGWEEGGVAFWFKKHQRVAWLPVIHASQLGFIHLLTANANFRSVIYSIKRALLVDHNMLKDL